MFQNVPGCPGILRVFRNISGYSAMFRDAQECSVFLVLLTAITKMAVGNLFFLFNCTLSQL